MSEQPLQELCAIGQLGNIQTFLLENATELQPWFVWRLR